MTKPQMMVVESGKLDEALEWQRLTREVPRLRKLIAVQRVMLDANRAKLKDAVARMDELAPVLSPLRQKRLRKPEPGEPAPLLNGKPVGPNNTMEPIDEPVLKAGDLGLTD